MRAYCKECMHFRYCLERTRDIPRASYEERRRQNGLRKGGHSRTGRALAGTPGTAPGAKEEGLSAAEVADHEPGPDGSYLHHGGGDLGTAGGTDVKGGKDYGSQNHGRRGI